MHHQGIGPCGIPVRDHAGRDRELLPGGSLELRGEPPVEQKASRDEGDEQNAAEQQEQRALQRDLHG